MRKIIAIPATAGVMSVALLATSEPASAHGGGGGNPFEGTDPIWWLIIAIVSVIGLSIYTPWKIRQSREARKVYAERAAERLNQRIAKLHAEYVSVIGMPGHESPIIVKTRRLTDHYDGSSIVMLHQLVLEFKDKRRALGNVTETITESSQAQLPTYGRYSDIHNAERALKQIAELIRRINDLYDEIARQYTPIIADAPSDAS